MPLVLITYDEFTSNANDSKRSVLVKKDQQPLRQRGREKRTMVSGFLTPGGRLQIPGRVADDMLCNPALHNGPAPKMANPDGMLWYDWEMAGTIGLVRRW